jgi:hypothetical protein
MHVEGFVVKGGDGVIPLHVVEEVAYRMLRDIRSGHGNLASSAGTLAATVYDGEWALHCSQEQSRLFCPVDITQSMFPVDHSHLNPFHTSHIDHSPSQLEESYSHEFAEESAESDVLAFFANEDLIYRQEAPTPLPQHEQQCCTHASPMEQDQPPVLSPDTMHYLPWAVFSLSPIDQAQFEMPPAHHSGFPIMLPTTSLAIPDLNIRQAVSTTLERMRQLPHFSLGATMLRSDGQPEDVTADIMRVLLKKFEAKAWHLPERDFTCPHGGDVIKFRVVDDKQFVSERGRSNLTTRTHNIVTWTQVNQELWALDCAWRRIVCLGRVRSSFEKARQCSILRAMIGNVEVEDLWRGICSEMNKRGDVLQRTERVCCEAELLWLNTQTDIETPFRLYRICPVIQEQSR